MSSSPNHLRTDCPDPSPDALIARVLTGLRDTQPPPDLNDRILQNLNAHAPAFLPCHSERSEEPASAFAVACSLLHTIRNSALAPLAVAAGRRTWRIATAAAFATALLIAALVTLHSHNAPHATAHLTPPQPVPTTPAPTQLVHAQPPRTIWVPHSSRSFSRGEWARTTLHTAQPPTDPLAAEALADTLAPSHPAPPLPLTEQEKLLLRVLQRNNPVELAQLDPVQLAASLARDRAEYRKFFTPPPPPPQNPTPAEIAAQTPDQVPAQPPATPDSGDQP